MAFTNSAATFVVWVGIAFAGATAAKKVFNKYKQTSGKKEEEDGSEKRDFKDSVLQTAFIQWLIAAAVSIRSTNSKPIANITPEDDDGEKDVVDNSGGSHNDDDNDHQTEKDLKENVTIRDDTNSSIESEKEEAATESSRDDPIVSTTALAESLCGKEEEVCNQDLASNISHDSTSSPHPGSSDVIESEGGASGDEPAMESDKGGNQREKVEFFGENESLVADNLNGFKETGKDKEEEAKEEDAKEEGKSKKVMEEEDTRGDEDLDDKESVEGKFPMQHDLTKEVDADTMISQSPSYNAEPTQPLQGSQQSLPINTDMTSLANPTGGAEVDNNGSSDYEMDRESTSSCTSAFSVLDIELESNQDGLQSIDVISCDTSLMTSLKAGDIEQGDMISSDAHPKASNGPPNDDVSTPEGTFFSSIESRDLSQSNKRDADVVEDVGKNQPTGEVLALREANLKDILENTLKNGEEGFKIESEAEDVEFVGSQEEEMKDKARSVIKQTMTEICGAIDQLVMESAQHMTSGEKVTSEESSQIPSDAQESSQIPSDAQESSQIPSDAQKSSQIPSDAQESSQIPSDAQKSSQIPSDAQESSQIPSDAQESSQTQKDSEKTDPIKTEKENSGSKKEKPPVSEETPELKLSGSTTLSTACDMKVQMKLVTTDQSVSKHVVAEEIDTSGFMLYIKNVENLNLKNKAKVHIKIALLTEGGVARRKMKTQMMKPAPYMAINKVVEFEKVPPKLMNGRLQVSMWSSSTIGANKKVFSIDTSFKQKIGFGKSNQSTLREVLQLHRGAWVDATLHFQ